MFVDNSTRLGDSLVGTSVTTVSCLAIQATNVQSTTFNIPSDDVHDLTLLNCCFEPPTRRQLVFYHALMRQTRFSGIPFSRYGFPWSYTSYR